MKNVQIDRFLENLLKSVGGIITHFGEYYEADMPRELTDRLGVSNPIRYTLEKSVAQSHTDIHYADRGTPFFKKIMASISQSASVTRGYFPFPAEGEIQAPDAAGIQEFFRTRKIDGVQVDGIRPVYIPKIELQFHLNIQSQCSESLISKEIFDALDISPIAALPAGLKKPCKQPSRKVEEVYLQENIISVFLRVLKTIESRIKQQVENVYHENSKGFELEKGKVNQFYEMVKEELEDRKESLYYHLYFFQKEEKINKIILEQEKEWDLKLKINQLKYRFKAFLDIFNAYIYFFPAYECALSIGGKDGKEKELKVYHDLYFHKTILPRVKKGSKTMSQTEKPLKKTA